MSNPKPHTLPVLREEHEKTLVQCDALIAADLRRYPKTSRLRITRLYDIATVVRALVSGTHEIQERVSGDTVRVPRKDVKTIRRWLRSNASHGDVAAVIEKIISRWLSRDKP